MKVDLIIKNGNLFNSYLKKFIKEDIAILDGKIFYVGIKDIDKLEPTEVVDAKNKYVLPGLIDIHMHIDSSMSTPYNFSKFIKKCGVTTLVSEPHEIANALGVEGVNEMIKESEKCDIDIFIGVPSCVPSSSEKLETTKGIFTEKEIEQLLNNKNVACLGEFMNYYDLSHKEKSRSHNIVSLVREKYQQYPIEGHIPKLSELNLAKVLYHGVDSDHTKQTVDGLVERIKRGMFVELQRKSLTPEIINKLKELNAYEHVALVTDDTMPNDLIKTGHLNNIVKKAISLGIDKENAVYMATYTPSRRMRFYDRGALSSGKIADIIIVDDFEKFTIEKVYKKGKLIYDYLNSSKEVYNKPHYPKHFYNTVKVPAINAEKLILTTEKVKNGKVICRVMEIKNSTSTSVKEIHQCFEVKNNRILWEKTDCLLIAVIERYGINNNISLGLIKGDTISRGAVATTYAHDHHNLLVIGKKVEDIILCINNIKYMQGGICVAENNTVISKLSLPIGGIVSDKPIEELGKYVENTINSLKKLGYKHHSPIMSLCTNGLPVSPFLKITDKGLIDVMNGCIVDLVVGVAEEN